MEKQEKIHYATAVKNNFYSALKYVAGLSGETICVGLAHDKKDALWRTI